MALVISGLYPAAGYTSKEFRFIITASSSISIPIKPRAENNKMRVLQSKQLHPIAVLLLISGIGSPPAPAADPTDVIQTGAPVIPKLIGRILEDPYRDYDSVKGPDDCNSESLYLGSKEMLAKYVADPEANAEALREYIISSEEQCNCTAAIVRKEFDILLDHLEADISKVPCL